MNLVFFASVWSVYTQASTKSKLFLEMKAFPKTPLPLPFSGHSALLLVINIHSLFNVRA